MSAARVKAARARVARGGRELAAARADALRTARSFLAVCRDPDAHPACLIDAAADVRQASGRLCCAAGLLRDAAVHAALVKGREARS
jgi:hypothetical protein